MEDFSRIVIETLRELSDSRQPLSVDTLSKALRSRGEVRQLLGSKPAGNDRVESTETGSEIDTLRSRLRGVQEEKRKQSLDLERLQERHTKTEDFARRALVNLAAMFGHHEGEAVAAALADFRQKLKGELNVELLEETLQRLKHLILQEGLAEDEPSEAQPSRWGKWFGRRDPGKRRERTAEEHFKQLQSVYLEILRSLQRETSQDSAQHSSALQGRVMECEDLTQLLALSREIIAFIHEHSRTAGEERFLITSFITDIGANLAQIEQHFLSSMSLNLQVQQSNSKFNALLDGQMEEIKNHTQMSETLAELKGLVSSRLSAIREAVEQKRGEDQRRWEEAKREKELLEQNLQCVRREIEQVQEKTRALELETLLDPLTGIHNRRAYEQRLKEEMQRFRRYGQIFSLLILDIDHFKGVNDKYGHAAGDRCLKEMIRRLKPILRECDFLARYGGEEFVALLPGIDSSGAYQVGEKLRRTITNTRFQFRGSDIPFTISVGVSEVKASDIDEETLFQRVDNAVYEAKRTGRNRTVAL